VTKVLGALLAVMLLVGIVAGVIALQALIAMLLLGAAHHAIHDGIPALGYGASVVLVLLLNFVGGFFRSVRTK
jgi:uncharacterized membrane protein